MSKTIDTSIGKICVKETDGYIVSVSLDCIEEVSPTALEIKTAIELDEYFKGTRKQFTVPYKVNATPFAMQVYNALEKVPYGKTISYQELAILIGDKKKCRAVGNALHVNPLLILIPCHRVIKKDQTLGGFALGDESKKALLQLEKKNA